jgi:UDP-N-acetylglucosamine 4,6-dehydratase/5-epimerase
MRDIKSVLITGGAGFFGRACARFLLRNDMVERLCIFSRGEHAQAAMRAELGDDPRLRFFIGDVRDEDRLARAMHGTDVVIHAAALKRVEVGRYNPDEMVKTNVLGAVNVVAAAQRAAVKRVVALSTDKAFQPVANAYGLSKAMMEQIILSANDTGGHGGPILSVTRYGNIFGSAGSVLPKWLEIISRTGRRVVPVTDPECTRFFMTLDESVELVISTVAHARGGEVAVPTLPAYRLGDLAEALGAEMEVTGLPVWEKTHESMTEGNSSDRARRMSVAELRRHVEAFAA